MNRLILGSDLPPSRDLYHYGEMERATGFAVASALFSSSRTLKARRQTARHRNTTHPMNPLPHQRNHNNPHRWRWPVATVRSQESLF